MPVRALGQVTEGNQLYISKPYFSIACQFRLQEKQQAFMMRMKSEYHGQWKVNRTPASLDSGKREAGGEATCMRDTPDYFPRKPKESG